MRSLRIYLPEELERKFRRASMECYGYSRGSLSKAAADAIRRWIRVQETMAGIEIPSEPVRVLRGLLSHVEKSSVELQHEAAEIRVDRARAR
ncbi:hypothetical protein KEJ39_05210 [Candidatus Bathyarchaeota archaeon]|nr:hypothetical protein [Candidatus Bathyarchaeota archaeon]